jgi:hypothetical protein
MKFSKALVSFVALTCLVACNNSASSTVSKEQFAEEVAKIEEHQYATAQARVEYSVKYTFTGFTPEQEAAIRQEIGGDESFAEEAGFTWGGDEAGWTTNYEFQHSESRAAAVASVGRNVKDMSIDQLGEGVQFYLNPFKIVQHTEVPSNEMITDSSVVFDNYGFVTLLEAKMVMTQTIAEGMSITANGYSKLTVSYADAK